MMTVSRKLCGMALMVASVGLAAPVYAQYVWMDANNVRHYSDMPPPSSVPADRILKTPRGKRTGPAYEMASSDTTPARKTDTAANPAKAPVSLADKNAEFQKRRMQQADKEKKAEEAEKRTAEKQKSCDRNQGYKKSLETGRRIAYTDKNGERIFMDDKERARELEEVNQRLQGCN